MKKREFLRLLMLLGLWAGSLSMYAQESRLIRGKVVSTTGEELPGVNIIIKGSTTGTITDITGNYQIQVDNPAQAVLVFRFIGFTEQEIAVAAQNTINVTLSESSIGLQEVVAIGYGTVRRRDVVGSVASVSGEMLKNIPVSSTAQAITGRLAGVQITTTEGSPDAEIRIRVRGGGSITQDNSPLYVVDGFEVRSISDIAPSDIESIDILKDAASTAIYGSKGANGVIIITTKSGFDGKTEVNYNMYYGVKKITNTLDVMSPYEYVLWQYELGGASGAGARNFQRYYGVFDDLELYKYQNGRDWQDEIFGRTATTQYHNISVSGGSKTGKFSLGLTRSDEEGIMLGSGFERNNINFKYNGKVSEKFSFDFNTRLSDTYITGAGTSVSGSSTDSRLRHAIKYPPIRGIQEFLSEVDFDNDLETTSQLYNPIEVVNDDYRTSDRLVLNFNGAVNYKIQKNLTFRTEWGVEYNTERNDRFYGPSTSQAKNSSGGNPMVTIEHRSRMRQRMANTVTWDKKNFLPNQNINFLLGQEISMYDNKNVVNESRFFPAGITPKSALAMMNLGTPQPTRSYESPRDNMTSFFSRINYVHSDKYLATVTLRADGSSKFAKGNQWGYFPSAALGWRLSEEAFLTDYEWLSNAMLRLSYGTAGNNRIGDDLWKLVFDTSDGNKPYFIDEKLQNQLIPGSTLSNPELKWETTITQNVGLDVAILNARISGTIDAYWNKTRDLLIAADIPTNTGYSTQMQNIGETSNKGIEFIMDGLIVKRKDFSLKASFNISFNKNRVEELGDIKKSYLSSNWFGTGGPTGDFLLEEGRPVGLMYGYKTNGMYSFDDFTYNSSTQTYTLKPGIANNQNLIGPNFWGPGTLKFKKLGGDGSTVNPEEDRTIIGNANPKHIGGFNLAANYKGFDVSVFFNWVYGNDVYNANKLEFTSYPNTRLYGNLITDMNYNNRFSIVNNQTGAFIYDPSALSAMNSGKTIWHPMMSRMVLHSWAVEDGSFLRLNNLTIGYSLPIEFTSRFHIKSLRFYVTGYNLYTWTKYSGYDPEVDTRRSTPLTPNVDYSAYPRSRTLIGGLNLTF